MKQWKPEKGPLPARKIATDVKETEAKEFKDFLREHVRSFDLSGEEKMNLQLIVKTLGILV